MVIEISLKQHMSCNQQLAKVAEDHRFAPIFVRKLPSLPQAPFPKNKLKPGRPEHNKTPEAITWLLRLPLAKERQTLGWCASNVLVIITLHDEISEREIRTICSFIGVPFPRYVWYIGIQVRGMQLVWTSVGVCSVYIVFTCLELSQLKFEFGLTLYVVPFPNMHPWVERRFTKHVRWGFLNIFLCDR